MRRCARLKSFVSCKDTNTQRKACDSDFFFIKVNPTFNFQTTAMRSFLTLFCSLFAVTVFSQDFSQDSAWFVNNYYKIEQYIPMRDGVKLFTSIYIPKDSSEKHPILMKRTPYNCEPYGANKYHDFWSKYQRYYLREGYIMVLQDVRGRWMSEGQFVDVRPFIK